MRVDLHTHSNASDGALTPHAVAALAAERGLDGFALTDHDTLAGCRQLAAEPPPGIRFVPGVELSTVWSGVGIHIVGLDFDLDARVLNAGIARQTEARFARARRISEVLGKAGLDAPVEAITARAAGVPGRPHFAQHLVETGQVVDEAFVFKKWLGAGKPGDIKTGWAGLADVVDWIVDAGGRAVLAHPARYKLTRTKLRALVKAFTDSGGQAIEVVSGQQTPDITTGVARLARDFALEASVGSDFHRQGGHGHALGQPLTLPSECTPVWSNFDWRD
ncbi:MAG: PHP domain-containing protein [Pseudomonadota bacterium]